MATSDKPRFKHDCDRCVFLGKYDPHGGGSYDLYFCADDGGGTVVARYDNHGADYTSHRVETIRPMLKKHDKHPLAVALIRHEGGKIGLDEVQAHGG